MENDEIGFEYWRSSWYYDRL